MPASVPPPSPIRPVSASRGFTLIELLTVIAIIGILAAILIPTMAKVRAQAKQSTNLSNVRQWTAANLMHAGDWNGYVPYQGSGISLALIDDETPFIGGVLPWWNALPRYLNEKSLKERKALNSLPRIGDGSIWVSPMAEDPSPGNEWATFLCYAPSRTSNTPASSPANRYVANVNKITEPARTVMFGETPHFTKALRNGVPYPFFNPNTTPNAVGPYNRNGTASERGGEGGKVALGFFDGSVRTYLGSVISKHGTNQTAERGNDPVNNPEGLVWRLTPN